MSVTDYEFHFLLLTYFCERSVICRKLEMQVDERRTDWRCRPENNTSAETKRLAISAPRKLSWPICPRCTRCTTVRQDSSRLVPESTMALLSWQKVKSKTKSST